MLTGGVQGTEPSQARRLLGLARLVTPPAEYWWGSTPQLGNYCIQLDQCLGRAWRLLGSFQLVNLKTLDSHQVPQYY